MIPDIEANGGMRILIVDDDRDVAATYRPLLEPAGYTVIAAHSVREALDLLDEQRDVRLVISDVRMPGVDGLDLVRVLRHRFPELPAILFTGASLTDDDIVPRGAVVMRKPVAIEELKRTIAQTLHSVTTKARALAVAKSGDRA